MTQASLPLSQKPLVTSWRGWISISFTLRIVSGFVLLINSCLPLSPASVPTHPLPCDLSLPYLTFLLHPALFARFLVPYWLLTGTAQRLSAHSLGSCIKALPTITVRVTAFV